MFSTTITGTVHGVQAYLVRVEADVSGGLPAFLMVGSLSLETREARERVMVSLKNKGIQIPPRHITVNLSPGDRRKDGTAFDLGIAVAILKATEMIPSLEHENTLFLGELGLGGEIRPAKGVLPIVQEAVRQGIKECIVPMDNAKEAAVIPGIDVRGARDITQVIDYLSAGKGKGEKILPLIQQAMPAMDSLKGTKDITDFSEIAGQEMAKRAAEIAAAGFHNLLMVGPPGVGKSMIACCLSGILPPLTREESLEVTSIKSIAGQMEAGETLCVQRPFVSPHHSISLSALVGGGTIPKPGRISLAHRGVLFLDELPEFDRNVLDALRQPLEERKIHISRVGGNVAFPADFIFVGAMNPCTCGYYPDRNRCHCSEPEVARYMRKVSGPILDRIDLCVELQPVAMGYLGKDNQRETSEIIRKRVERAREIQFRRFRNTPFQFNGDIPGPKVEEYCDLGIRELKCMEELYGNLQLSVRSYHRILRVARTIADMDEKERIGVEHLMEAAMYRPSLEYWK